MPSLLTVTIDARNYQFIYLLQLIANLTSPLYAASIRSQITDDVTHEADYYGPTFYNNDDAGTVHISVLAPNGDAVSITSTVNI